MASSILRHSEENGIGKKSSRRKNMKSTLERRLISKLVIILIVVTTTKNPVRMNEIEQPVEIQNWQMTLMMNKKLNKGCGMHRLA